jgi:hypothetical protein
MKKKLRLDNGETVVAEVDSPAIRKSVLLLFNYTERRLVLLVDASASPSVFLLVGKHDTGTLEYQVSDGMEGNRSHSFDFYNLREAMDCFDKVCDKGWKNV